MVAQERAAWMEGFVVVVKAILLRGYVPLWHSRIDPGSSALNSSLGLIVVTP
jgi:hypothetical protein